MKIKKPQKKEERKTRTYRASDTLYNAATKKAEKKKESLSARIEDFLYDYISK
jgi:predicted HicB family RNase H-like nuclease